jgi:hypothetical protein
MPDMRATRPKPYEDYAKVKRQMCQEIKQVNSQTYRCCLKLLVAAPSVKIEH